MTFAVLIAREYRAYCTQDIRRDAGLVERRGPSETRVSAFCRRLRLHEHERHLGEVNDNRYAIAIDQRMVEGRFGRIPSVWSEGNELGEAQGSRGWFDVLTRQENGHKSTGRKSMFHVHG
jgi:hypothetical protein